jgi:hypothetical protein
MTGCVRRAGMSYGSTERSAGQSGRVFIDTRLW